MPNSGFDHLQFVAFWGHRGNNLVEITKLT
jgi:hypothetical protein